MWHASTSKINQTKGGGGATIDKKGTCSALQVSTGRSSKETQVVNMMLPCIPINGTASDVVGIFSATRLRKTVNERSMVTPEMKISNFESVCVSVIV